ncbi:MAG: extracellular solute-binding protein, partial [Vallitaleaceae bacterium]|nr:extracellular solute-binding protein [Vallitaleaceae bacterium]
SFAMLLAEAGIGPAIVEPINGFVVGEGGVVDFPDQNLKNGIIDALESMGNTVDDQILYEDLLNITQLNINSANISDLTGIQALENLVYLDLEGNNISDITPLAGLIQLDTLTLWNNYIVDVSPLSGLVNLNYLDLENNEIDDIMPLAGLNNLETLYLTSNYISSVLPLSGLSNLTALSVSNNMISDISPIANLINLSSLYIEDNPITDVSVLDGLTNLYDYDFDFDFGSVDASTWMGETISVWSYTNEIVPAAEAFEDKYGVTVEINIIPTEDYPDTIRPALQSGVGAPDVYTAEAAFIDDFVNDGYMADLSALGAEDYEYDYVDYVYDVGVDEDGILRALSWQMATGAVYYRRSIALEVFGTDDPSTISNMMSSYEGLFNMAADLKSGGYRLFPDESAFRWFTNPEQTAWVDSNNNLQLTDARTAYFDYAKMLRDNGYTAEAGEWSPEWFAGMQGPIDVGSSNASTEVFAYCMPTWGLHYVLKTSKPVDADTNPTAGDWAAATGPNSYYWGGTWLGVYEGSDKKDIAFGFVNWLTHDEEYLRPWLMETGDVTSVLSIAESYEYKYERSDDFLGGQNHIEFFVDTAYGINGDAFTEYDDEINLYFANAVSDYVNGNSTLAQAILNFKEDVKSAYPEINVN